MSIPPRPGQQGPRGASGARRAPSALHNAPAPELRRGVGGTAPVLGFPHNPLRAAPPAASSAVCLCPPAAEHGHGWLFPRAHPLHPRGSTPSRRFPVPSALAGPSGTAPARRGGPAVWEKAERRPWMLPSFRQTPICLLLASVSLQPLSAIIITIAINYPCRAMCL